MKNREEMSMRLEATIAACRVVPSYLLQLRAILRHLFDEDLACMFRFNQNFAAAQVRQGKSAWCDALVYWTAHCIQKEETAMNPYLLFMCMNCGKLLISDETLYFDLPYEGGATKLQEIGNCKQCGIELDEEGTTPAHLVFRIDEVRYLGDDK